MVRLLWWQVRQLIATRRTIGAWVAYAAVLAVLYATPGPVDELSVATAVALVPVTTWVVAAGCTLDRSSASMLAAAAGGSLRLHALHTAAGLVAALPLAVVAVVGDLLVGEPLDGRSVAVASASAHLVAVLVGAGVGAVAARPVVHDLALSLVVGVLGFVLVAVAPGVSPLAPALENIATGRVEMGAAWCAAAVLWGAALTGLGGMTAARRRSYGTAAAP